MSVLQQRYTHFEQRTVKKVCNAAKTKESNVITRKKINSNTTACNGEIKMKSIIKCGLQALPLLRIFLNAIIISRAECCFAESSFIFNVVIVIFLANCSMEIATSQLDSSKQKA